MTYEEAINNLRYAKFLVENDNEINEDDETVVDTKFIDIAIACVEKQIPKKPKYIYRLAFRPVWAECCECGHVIPVNSKYCTYCGQALDWSEEE